MTRAGQETEQLIPGTHSISVGLTDMPAPHGWVWTRLLDIARLESGHTPSRSHPEYWDGDVPWVGIKDARVHHGGVINDTFQKVTEEGLANSAARWLPANTVCLSRTASVGYVTVLGRPMATSQDFVNWICSDALEPKFLMQALLAEGDGLLRFGMGTTHTTIYFPQVMAFHVCIPPVPQQRRIVAKLEALTAKSRRAKEALDAIPPLLERFRQSVLASAFRGDLTAAWRVKNPDVEPADKLLARIRIERRRRWEEAELARMQAKGKTPGDDRWKEKYEEPEPVNTEGLPELPEGWGWMGADDCASEITVGHVGPMQHRYAPTGVPFLRSQNVRANRFDPTELRFIPDDFHSALSKSALHPGDLVVVRTGAPGTACVVPDTLENANCSDLVIVRLLSVVLPELIAFYVNSRDAMARILDMQVGVAQQHFNVGSMKRLPIPVLPLSEQAVLLDKIKMQWRSIGKIEQQLREVRASYAGLDRSILAKAFRGELVPQDPSDEPASILLDRIRAERAAGSLAKEKKPLKTPKRA